MVCLTKKSPSFHNLKTSIMTEKVIDPNHLPTRKNQRVKMLSKVAKNISKTLICNLRFILRVKCFLTRNRLILVNNKTPSKIIMLVETTTQSQLDQQNKAANSKTRLTMFNRLIACMIIFKLHKTHFRTHKTTSH